jgi:hypothetical protein
MSSSSVDLIHAESLDSVAEVHTHDDECGCDPKFVEYSLPGLRCLAR